MGKSAIIFLPCFACTFDILNGLSVQYVNTSLPGAPFQNKTFMLKVQIALIYKVGSKCGIGTGRWQIWW